MYIQLPHLVAGTLFAHRENRRSFARSALFLRLGFSLEKCQWAITEMYLLRMCSIVIINDKKRETKKSGSKCTVYSDTGKYFKLFDKIIIHC